MRTISVLIFQIFFIQSSGQTLKYCSTCSTQVIKSEQIKGLGIDEIRLLTNEIFARNGRKLTITKVMD